MENQGNRTVAKSYQPQSGVNTTLILRKSVSPDNTSIRTYQFWKQPALPAFDYLLAGPRVQPLVEVAGF
jgi:hypothetical protein